eukprot:403354766
MRIISLGITSILALQALFISLNFPSFTIQRKYYEKQSVNSAPLIIAHRGSFGYFPEHTEPAYHYAFFEGAHFIDIDIQPTKDGHLVIHHEPALDGQLIGEEMYPHIFKESLRKSWKNPLTNYTYQNDFMIRDFTLQELKLLRRVQRFPKTRSTYFDGMYPIMSLQEAIDYIKQINSDLKTNRNEGIPMGIYIEIKQTDYYHDELGIDINSMLLDILRINGLDTYEKAESHNLPVMIQSFYLSSIKFFQNHTNLPSAYCIEVLNKNWTIPLLKEQNVKIIAIENIFLNGTYLLNNYGKDDIVELAHSHNIQVQIFTARDDMLKFHPIEKFQHQTQQIGNMTESHLDIEKELEQEQSGQQMFIEQNEGALIYDEYKFYFDKNIDAIFTEFPKSAKIVFGQLSRDNFNDNASKNYRNLALIDVGIIDYQSDNIKAKSNTDDNQNNEEVVPEHCKQIKDRMNNKGVSDQKLEASVVDKSNNPYENDTIDYSTCYI